MTMRGCLLAVLGVALAACTPTAKTESNAVETVASCNQSTSREIALLGPTPDYVVEARAFEGPKPSSADAAAMATSNPCASATVVLTFRRKNDGAFVHGYATSMNRMDLIEGHAGPPFDGARLRAFLEGWTNATVSTTDKALPASETVTTQLDAAAYTAMKAAKKPVICYETSVHDTACYVVAPDDVYYFAPFYVEDHS